MTPDFLTLQDILRIHQDQIQRYGGSLGVRDLGLMESAIAMPQAGFSGQYFHTDLCEMGAAYLFHLTQNHPFIDGNKRVGTVAALVFLDLNGISLELSNEALVDLTLGVAEGKQTKSAIAEFFRKHSR
ncbi:MAG TPA: type II toxin-antitoxin system death-on-curing family toxin [Planctomycetota bacterium]|nr:type II toxin-antitoxin system death-on-curing family toxin [Planctomycetota bacterium]